MNMSCLARRLKSSREYMHLGVGTTEVYASAGVSRLALPRRLSSDRKSCTSERVEALPYLRSVS